MRKSMFRSLLPVVTFAAIASLTLFEVPQSAAADDNWGPDTRRAGISFEYGFAFSTLSGDAADNFGLKSPGVGWFNLSFGFQFDELLELRGTGYVEDGNSGGATTRDVYGILFGLRIHPVPGNTYNWRVPNMLDLFADFQIGWSEISNHDGTGYINGLELRLGLGVRGSFDTRGTWDNPGIYWYASAAFRIVAYSDFEIAYVASSTTDTLEDFVFMFGVGIML